MLRSVWDGNALWLKITAEQVIRNYERDDIVPDPSRYFVKDYPYYNPAYYPELVIVPPRFQRPVYCNATELQSLQSNQRYSCDLCIISFASEENLSSHVKLRHK